MDEKKEEPFGFAMPPCHWILFAFSLPINILTNASWILNRNQCRRLYCVRPYYIYTMYTTYNILFVYLYIHMNNLYIWLMFVQIKYGSVNMHVCLCVCVPTLVWYYILGMHIRQNKLFVYKCKRFSEHKKINRDRDSI